jgi:hypothetical protein
MNQPTRITIFVPLTRENAAAFRQAGQTTDRLSAYAATAQMLAAHEYPTAASEEANYAAQTYARIAGLAEHSRCETGAADRQPLTVAADVPANGVVSTGRDADYGSVVTAGLAWDDVMAVFAEDPSAAAAVRSAVGALAEIPATPDDPAGPSLDDSLSLPAVQHLLADHEQLWYHPGEDW